jgi:hypothetical protein
MNENAPTPERRRSRRRLPRRTVRIYLRLGAFDLGANLALSLLDLSEGGAALSVTEAIEPGKVVSIGLEAQSQPRPLLRTANVVWCRPGADGAHMVGVSFEKDLPYKAFNDLTQPIREANQYELKPDKTAADFPSMTEPAAPDSARE